MLQLLEAARLPLAGLPENLDSFVVADLHGRVVAAAGLELYGESALLRSVVVDPECQGTGIGRRIVSEALELARGRGAAEVFLLTTTAEEWFPRFGFSREDRSRVPQAMLESAEFRGACPASAVLMRLRLGALPAFPVAAGR
jgi:amino-acid N-acetyltransferase